MNWTRTNDFTHGADIRAYLDVIMEKESPIYRFEVLASTTIGEIYYAAVSSIHKQTRTKEVAVVVCPYKYDQNEPETQSFSYCRLTDVEAPPYAYCPTEILDLLDTPTSNAALDWQYGCYEYHNKRKTEYTIQCKNSPTKKRRRS